MWKGTYFSEVVDDTDASSSVFRYLGIVEIMYQARNLARKLLPCCADQHHIQSLLDTLKYLILDGILCMYVL
jgi:hypothetical protein